MIAVIGLLAFGMVHWKVGLPMALVLYGFSEMQLRRAGRRQFGQAMEQRAMPGALGELRRRGFQVQANVRMASGADIDLVVRKGNRVVTIEIKSFFVWKRILFFWNGRREAMAVRQARAQRAELKATAAMIWLPQGRSTHWFWGRYPNVGSGVRLVTGSARELSDAVECF